MSKIKEINQDKVKNELFATIKTMLLNNGFLFNKLMTAFETVKSKHNLNEDDLDKMFDQITERKISDFFLVETQEDIKWLEKNSNTKFINGAYRPLQ